MDATQWVSEFRQVHEAFRKGSLDEAAKRDYFAAREHFARALLNAQNLTVEGGTSARRSFRVAQGMQVELQLASGNVKLVTLDVSCGGFSAMIQKLPDEKEQPGFTMRLPGGVEPLVGRVTVASVVRRPGNARASFAFKDLAEKDVERLETILFDLVLARMA